MIIACGECSVEVVITSHADAGTYDLCFGCYYEHVRHGARDLRTLDGMLVFAPDTLRHRDGRIVRVESRNRWELRTGVRMPRFRYVMVMK